MQLLFGDMTTNFTATTAKPVTGFGVWHLKHPGAMAVGWLLKHFL